MKIYRYVKALEKVENSMRIRNKLEESLSESRICFSHPASFNDPLECIIPFVSQDGDFDIGQYIDDIADIISQNIGSINEPTSRNKRIYEAIRYGIPLEHCMVLCFSTQPDNQLLWSHYADQHRGICLGFEIPDTRDELLEHIKWSDVIAYDMKKFGLNLVYGPVRYQHDRPALIVKNGIIQDDYSMLDAIFTKPRCWSYEEEWRMVLLLPFDSEIRFPAGIDSPQFYATIPKAWLKEVTFGLRLDDHFCSELVDIIRDNGYPNVDFKRSILEYGTYGLAGVSYRCKK